MPVTASEVKAYGSAVMAEDDVTGPIGGAIDVTIGVSFLSPSAATAPKVNSSGVFDTGITVTIYGRKPGGAKVNETQTLNSTLLIPYTETFERIEKVVLSASAVGTITVYYENGSSILGVLDPGMLQLRVPFYDVVADVPGGSDRTYYEKFFIRNTNLALTLQNGVVAELSDGTGLITFGLPPDRDDFSTAANRRTAPSGITFDNAAKPMPNGQELEGGDAIGVWLKLDLPAGTTPLKTTWVTRVTGTSI